MDCKLPNTFIGFTTRRDERMFAKTSVFVVLLHVFRLLSISYSLYGVDLLYMGMCRLCVCCVVCVLCVGFVLAMGLGYV